MQQADFALRVQAVQSPSMSQLAGPSCGMTKIALKKPPDRT